MFLKDKGKGYSLMEGYRLPPVSFTESEANALITAELLVRHNKGQSFIDNYTNTVAKVKAVLKRDTKDKLDLLANRIYIGMDNDTHVDSILYYIDNEIHHRAQGTVYLRALGIEPPAFWDRY